MTNDSGTGVVTSKDQQGTKTFIVPAPGPISGPHDHNVSKLSKSNSDARFNHSGLLPSQVNSSIFNHSQLTSKNFGDKVYDRQSASTMLHSINSYSIPKASRFGDSRRDNFDNGGVVLKSTLSVKGTDFIKASARRPLIQVTTSQNPGPGEYPLKSDFGKVNYDQNLKKFVADKVDSKGRTFGIAYSHYKNAFTLGMDKNVSGEAEVKAKPGPGTYEQAKTFGKAGKACTLAPKLAHGGQSGGLGPIYNPNFKLVEQARYDYQSMGKGGRYDFTKATLGNPGPEYKLPSVFDKYKNPKTEVQMEKARQKSIELARKRSIERASQTQENESLSTMTRKQLLSYN